MSKRFKPDDESLEKIIENLKCYKCNAIPGPNGDKRNRYNCVNNSHTLCETCKAKCKCGSSVVKCPSPLVHQILEELPVPWFCSHYKNGCRENFLKIDGIDDHQKNCIFRMIHCPKNVGGECNEKILFKNIGEHLATHAFVEYETEQFLKSIEK